MSNETKILLDNTKVHQLSGNTLTLSGTTIVKNLQYLSNNSSNYNIRSIPDIGFVTGNTNVLLNKINFISGSTGLLSAGIIGNSDPVLTDNNNGTATINSVYVNLYPTTDFNGYLHQYYVSGNTFTFVDGNEEYIAVNYNSGNPIMYKETNEANINGSNIKRIFTTWRQGTTIHSFNFDREGLGLSNKLQISEYNKAKYIRSNNSGLTITESSIPANRTVIVSNSLVYTGAIMQNVLAFNSSIDTLTEATVTSSVWSYNNVSVYNNTQYNPPTGPTTMTSNKWKIVWFYRNISNIKQVFYTLSDSLYNNQAATELAIERTDLPTIIRHHCLLIGRSLILYNASTGFIESAFTTFFNPSQVINHNDTGNIQGGDNVSQYYHLNQTNYLNLTGTTSSIQQQINHISGVTNTKLNTSLFNTYTGNTHSYYSFAASDETSNLTVGTAKFTDRMPFAMNVNTVKLSLVNASTGLPLIVDIFKNGTTIFNTKISVNVSGTTSVGATTPYVLTSTPTIFNDDDIIRADITQVGNGNAGKGLKIHLIS